MTDEVGFTTEQNFDAKFLGLVAGSDATGGIGHGGNYGQGPVSILRGQLLFY